MTSDSSPHALSIVISAMGGQGGGVLSRWIVDVAERGGYLAQATSVPGVAQRTGATIYYIELFPQSAAEAAGREPVLALMPVPGHVDLLIAAELVEAGRAVLRGLVTADRTTVVASSHREYSVVEKTALGDGIADNAGIRQAVDQAAARCVMFDMAEQAVASGSVISSVLLGAVAATGRLPFDPQQFQDAIRRSGIAVQRSLAGFAAGAAAAGDEPCHTEAPLPGPLPATSGSRGASLRQRVDDSVPEPVRPMVIEGLRRMADYQDLRYAGDYLNRLQPILEIDGGGSDGAYRLVSETARHLALWMSYEDAPRVADLKTRSTRFERMRQEVHAEPHQPVYPVEFMHPSVRELADILPAPLGRFILRHGLLRRGIDRAINRGRQIPTGKLRGFVLLYLVAGLRALRRISYRYQKEMQTIDTWLTRILTAAPADYELAVEIARCQRLIKGYGDTHTRGLHNFEAIMQALGELTAHHDAAATVRRLSEAALADEDGVALRSALAETIPAA